MSSVLFTCFARKSHKDILIISEIEYSQIFTPPPLYSACSGPVHDVSKLLYFTYDAKFCLAFSQDCIENLNHNITLFGSIFVTVFFVETFKDYWMRLSRISKLFRSASALPRSALSAEG